MLRTPPAPWPTCRNPVLPGASAPLYAAAARRLGHTAQEVFEGTALCDPPRERWVPWRDHVVANDRLLDWAGSDEALVAAVKETWAELGSGREINGLATALIGQVGLLPILANTANRSMVPGVEHQLVVQGQQLRVTVRIPEDQPACRAYLVADAGALECLLGRSGFSIRRYAWHAEARWMRVEAELERPVSLWLRIQRWLQWISGAEGAVALLAERSEELEASLVRAEQALAEAEAARVQADAARADALEAMQSRERMLSVLSHELRTPLHQITGLCDILEGEIGSSGGQEMLRLQRMAAQQLDDRIGQLLQVGGRDVGPRGEVTEVDVRELSARVLEAWRVHAGARLLVQADAAIVRLDPVGLRGTLDPLLDNALRFGETVAVSFLMVGDDLIVDVVDRGPGLPQDQLETLFEPFTQGDMTLTRSFDGLGVGLTLARRRAMALGGDLRALPRQGGAHLRVVLPEVRQHRVG